VRNTAAAWIAFLKLGRLRAFEFVQLETTCVDVRPGGTLGQYCGRYSPIDCPQVDSLPPTTLFPRIDILHWALLLFFAVFDGKT